MFCNPCSRRDVESKSTSWCSDCEEGLCSKCLEDHRVIKLTKSHHVVDMTEQISPEHYKLLSIPNCEIHEELRQDMVCKDHDLICCHQCFQSSHKSCKNVSHLDMAAKGIKQSDWLKKLDHDFKEMTKVNLKIIEERKVSKEELKYQVQKIKKKIANIKSKFIQHIDNLEKVLLHELATVDKDGEEESEKEKQELMNMEKEVQADHTALEFVTANGSESQIYSFVQNQSEKQKERVKKLKKIPPNSKVNIELHESSHDIEAIKSLGYLSVNYEHVTNPFSAQGLIISDESLSRTEKKDFPDLLLEKEEEIDPKDFLEENEVVDDIDLEVHCATVTDDNFIMVAGMLRLVVNENYKTVLQVVKYDEHMKYLQSCRLESIDRYSYFGILDITSIHKSDMVVVVYSSYDKREMIFISKSEMKKMRSLLDLSNYTHICLGSHNKRIYLHTINKKKEVGMSVFNVFGCRIQELNIRKSFDSFIVQPDNTLLGLNNKTLYYLKEDSTEIMSYRPIGLNAFTVDHHGNLFMMMADGVQVMHPKKDLECIHMAFLGTFDDNYVVEFNSFNKNQTRLLLLTAISKNSKIFGDVHTYSVKFLSELQMNH
ncbi:uncharacterized protein LOC134727945 [Mytilus trossulus]|uniref:uncharacterized protein LOC134727945 n=1 Tax=Mytilus trossulus TaxID=6551 RepID=UPI0030055729